MTANRRPYAITILAVIYIAIGAIGFVAHFPNLRATNTLQFEDFWIELTELIAIICGVFMLRRQNWARWLALAWMAFHVILSVLDRFHGLAIHALFFVAIAWLLFRADASRYFRDRPS